MKQFSKKLFANITWGEVALLLAAAFVAAAIAFRNVKFVGSEFDTLLYLNIAQFPRAVGGVLNRYAHIYLQKLFFVFFPQPLEAVKALWAFEIFGSAVFVYLSAKLLNLKTGLLTGLFALLFFFAQRKLYATAGAPLIEFTLMFFLCAGILLYLIYLNSRSKSPWLLFAMGLVQILLLKSKETGIIFAPLVLAAIYISGKDWPRRLRAALWAAGGVIAGLGLFALLDGILLGDPLFSFRPDSWKQLVQFNLTLVYDERSPLNWYDTILATALAVPVIFSLLAIWSDEKGEFDWPRRLLWALPVLLVIFLSFTMYRAAFPQNFRYLYPVFALFAIVGSQFIRLRQKGETRTAWRLIAASALAASALYAWVYPYAASQPFYWTESTFFTNVVASLLVSLVLLALLVPKSFKFSRELLLIPPLVVLMLTPILNIPAELQITRARADNFASPYEIYRSQISQPEGARLFFSSAPYSDLTMLGRDSGSTKYFFEAFFNVDVPPVEYSPRIQDLLSGEYDYAFVTRAELAAADLADDLAAAGYTVHDDPRSEVVLISRD